MAKTRKTEAKSPVKQASLTVQENTSYSTEQLPAFFSNTLLQSLLVFAFAFLLYAYTLGHGWAQDDAIVITDNMFTQKGFSGIGDIFGKDTFYGFFKVEGKAGLVSGGRYRPLTLAMFAVVYQFFGKNPMAFHFLTVLLFSLTCVLLYRTLLLMLRDYRGSGYAAIVAFMTTLLFAAHPIHTEAVANVKGCDEIVTLMGSLGALFLTLKAFDSKNMLYAAAAAFVFFLGLLAKENAATFLAIVPLALWYFRRAGMGQIVKFTSPLLLGFLVFFAIRASVLPKLFAPEPLELMNNPYLKVVNNLWVKFTPGERFATIFYTLGKYIQLLVFPHPLTHDYYPRHVEIMNFGKPSVLASLAVYGFLSWYAISGLVKGKRDLLRFGILFYLITLSIVSNLIFPIGTNMGERFMFMPSIGFCLVVAGLIAALVQAGEDGFKGKSTMAWGILGAVALLLAAKTLTRLPAWQDDKTLFFTDVNTSFNSAKLQNACGGVCTTEGMAEKDPAKKEELFRQAVKHLSKAVQIHPTYNDAFLNRGISYYNLKDFEAAISDFKMADFIAPNDPKGRNNLAIAYRDCAKHYGEQKGDLNKALEYLNKSYQINQKDGETLRLLGVANGVSRNHAEALKWFTKLVEFEPKNASSWYDLGTAYGATGDVAKAKECHAKAFELDPKVLEQRAAGSKK